MSEQGKFLEELEAVKSIAASQDNKLTKDEVKKYLSDLELSDDKMEQDRKSTRLELSHIL